MFEVKGQSISFSLESISSWRNRLVTWASLVVMFIKP